MNALGVQSHLFRGSPAQVAEAVSRHGLTCVQLTPNFCNLTFHQPGQLARDRCRRAAEPFHAAGIAVACLSGYTNFLDPDLDRRHRAIVRLHGLIRHCRDFGTDRLVTETGSLCPLSPWAPFPANRAPESWEELCLILAETLRMAADHGVVLLLKPEITQALASVEDALRLRAELDQPNLGFVLDPAVLLLEQPGDRWDQEIAHFFELLGPCSPVMHAKDLRMEPGGVTMPRVGRGTLNYRLIFQHLSRHQPDAPIILEHLRPEEVAETKGFVEGLLRSR